ncbi:2-dehydro-3-deoxy-6-phosphogalactonate aldolase [Methylobacterium sp. NEAU 140]|uniref:2-dehydro-3-deoxy-6-phosphogalactonate aldolase n=1 Tax=Methylobacterium sp. NEAU 140 TaxID=3064945 RepID=UPI0027355B2D|nr:2-dehydro-3-deoxy-6-phosphogalactonate aldolase [Methylobacterium sp. NEAU 140]MDP4022839.1 2-dehydro-3-deoxy-6-phosphogalactonate aldolase [Methylobacterium sp. NEAU 140]
MQGTIPATPPATISASAPWPNPRRPLVAILRGVRPDEADGIVDALVEEGFELIEIPLNSPDPFRSIASAAARHGGAVLIGAGTVLTVPDVDRLAEAGGRLLVSPNVDPAVLARAGAHGMVTMPGVLTPTEALLALRCGASALKFFPASVLGPAGIAAIRAVLPADAVIGAVGGVGDESFGAYAAAGIRTFGLGSSLYRPGDDAGTVRRNARRTLAAYDAAFPAGA